ncbi:MAG: glutamate-1-semialdehyde-2,1-aminomutase [Omnitrophica bacterium RIFCSPLOWO2_12_FULL_44_17]|uniref:Glutamate-1-semialdehyde 2,1-aminomutase n=1 Tax=Candidatus Danuiimicrobium aquiferis TaxID=1801832 RepID=A0A1G1KRE2_9BACT|nr:MAG: glutamate-1-semialdehyde-2,1-aminomutase [Omnitrophica bacterium RIFCSPHIGHO2_02_FULL_45_28]OGW95478.1 MAG: glutamate-1-semialdehyde-2,1-aminomutase [Omnitrophica bacterium RIFCSPLOWO2_12_FULL_44_17]OGX03357.1 MAG: glutamate-1-semialdehyde-2,1-aminomutase [Omnitrophica bacterium RIFCSPLOWO2_02_FULL_44_11]
MRKKAGKQIKKNHAQLFREANRYLVGGVNSPVRSFRSVGGDPVFVKQGKGSTVYAEDGRTFIDYCCSWGALILGHSHAKIIRAIAEAIKRGTSYGMPTALETELAQLLVEAIPSMEQVRLTNSGTEAVMGAIRVARAYTGKNKIIKFEGSYHGHADYLLVKAGSGASTLGIPDSLGVPDDFTKHTLVVPYNDSEKVKETVQKYSNDIAAIIVEPVAGNTGLVLPANKFLSGLRKICDDHHILLIFDEVITGFRLTYGGAQNYFNVKPDMTTLGKIIGGGMPMGAFGGRKDIMKVLSPMGGAYQAGTLSGNPIAVTAGITALKCLMRLKPYPSLAAKTEKLCKGIEKAATGSGIKISINSIGSMFTVFFTDEKVTDYATACRQNVPLFRKFYHGLLKRNIYFAPSAFETNFLSAVHTEQDMKKTIQATQGAFQAIAND